MGVRAKGWWPPHRNAVTVAELANAAIPPGAAWTGWRDSEWEHEGGVSSEEREKRGKISSLRQTPRLYVKDGNKRLRRITKVNTGQMRVHFCGVPGVAASSERRTVPPGDPRRKFGAHGSPDRLRSTSCRTPIDS